MKGASRVVLVVKNPPANAGNIRDVGSVPRPGRPPEVDTAIHPSNFAWRIPWTEETGGLQLIGSPKVGHDCRDLAAAALEVKDPSEFICLLGCNHGLNWDETETDQWYRSPQGPICSSFRRGALVMEVCLVSLWMDALGVLCPGAGLLCMSEVISARFVSECTYVGSDTCFRVVLRNYPHILWFARKTQGVCYVLHMVACHVCMLSCVRLFAVPWTVAPKALLSMGFSRQKH